jgi:hypothetical protein
MIKRAPHVESEPKGLSTTIKRNIAVQIHKNQKDITTKSVLYV